MSDDALAEVLATDDVVEAQIYKAMLEEAGVQVMEQESRVWSTHIMPAPLQPHIRLFVYEYDAPRVLALIQDYRQQVESGALALQDEEEVDGTAPPEPDVHPALRWALFAILLLLVGFLGFAWSIKRQPIPALGLLTACFGVLIVMRQLLWRK